MAGLSMLQSGGGGSQQGSTSSGYSKGYSQNTSGVEYRPEQLSRINQLYPALYGQFQQNSPGSFSQLLQQVGGPEVNTTGPYTPELVQKMLNQSQAGIRAGVGGQVKSTIPNAVAGAGFAAQSPAALGMRNQTINAGIGATDKSNTDIVRGTTEANADYYLKAMQLAQQRQNLGIQAQDQGNNYKNALVNAMVNLNAPNPFQKSRSKQESGSGSASFGQSYA